MYNIINTFEISKQIIYVLEYTLEPDADRKKAERKKMVLALPL